MLRLVYIDFAKAFDSISHVKLLTKSHAYSIDSNLLNWISNFLSERTQSVYIGIPFQSFFQCSVESLRAQSLVLCYL